MKPGHGPNNPPFRRPGRVRCWWCWCSWACHKFVFADSRSFHPSGAFRSFPVSGAGRRAPCWPPRARLEEELEVEEGERHEGDGDEENATHKADPKPPKPRQKARARRRANAPGFRHIWVSGTSSSGEGEPVGGRSKWCPYCKGNVTIIQDNIRLQDIYKLTS